MTFLKVLPDTATVVRPDPARIAAFHDAPLEIHMFYVGRGELNLVVFPDRRAWIIEAGSGNQWSENDSLGALLAQYFVTENLTLDALVMAHAHKDHVGALPSLLETGGFFYTSPLRLYRNDSTSWDRRRTAAGNWTWHNEWWRRVNETGDVEDLRQSRSPPPRPELGFRFLRGMITLFRTEFGNRQLGSRESTHTLAPLGT